MENQTVTVVQRVVPHYRTAFFHLLRERLSEHRVCLRLIHSAPKREDAMREDAGEPDWSEQVRLWRVPMAGGVYWQQAWSGAARSDLVVVEQASRPLLNYVLAASRSRVGFKLALWGHGRDHGSSDPTGLRARWKKRMTRNADWWFAYTEGSARLFQEAGAPAERITVVRNSTDTKALRAAVQAVSSAQLMALRHDLQLQGESVGLFIGGLYEQKRLRFLMAVAERIRSQVPDFELLIVGAGPDVQLARSGAVGKPWIHVVGPRLGTDAAPYFRLAKAVLMPGLVGLAVVDSFAAGVPLLTTGVTFHSPEIEYLESGRNGVIVDDPGDIAGFADAVKRVLLDETWRRELQAGALRSAETLTVEDMADRFTEGILRALA